MTAAFQITVCTDEVSLKVSGEWSCGTAIKAPVISDVLSARDSVCQYFAPFRQISYYRLATLKVETLEAVDSDYERALKILETYNSEKERIKKTEKRQSSKNRQVKEAIYQSSLRKKRDCICEFNT